MIKAILFDLDGVLLDTEYYTLKIKIDLLKKLNVEIDDDFIAQLSGRKFSDFIVEELSYLDNIPSIIDTYQMIAYKDIDYRTLEKENASYVLRKLKEKYIWNLRNYQFKHKL